jgi:hypothetical protein
VSPDRVELTWQGGEPATGAIVERSEAGAWAALEHVVSDGVARFQFIDRSILPGMRYGYRLRTGAEGSISYVGESWVDVPAVYRVALAGSRFNPSTNGRLDVEFELADESEARLELLDIAGRRIARREVGSFGPGRHSIGLAPGLSAGVYLIRLSTGGRSLTRSVSVLR